jgi:hypothetical protein
MWLKQCEACAKTAHEQNSHRTQSASTWTRIQLDPSDGRPRVSSNADQCQRSQASAKTPAQSGRAVCANDAALLGEALAISNHLQQLIHCAAQRLTSNPIRPLAVSSAHRNNRAVPWPVTPQHRLHVVQHRHSPNLDSQQNKFATEDPSRSLFSRHSCTCHCSYRAYPVPACIRVAFAEGFTRPAGLDRELAFLWSGLAPRRQCSLPCPAYCMCSGRHGGRP